MDRHSERKGAVQAWVVRLLSRYVAPPGLPAEGARREHEALVDAIVAKLPADLNVETVKLRLENTERKLLETYRKRSWPTIAEVLEALREASAVAFAVKGDGDGDGDGYDPMYEWMVRTWSKGRWVHGSAVTDARLRRLIRSGVATARELWEAGIDVPADLREPAPERVAAEPDDSFSF